MAAELKTHFGEDSELVPSGGGVFEVSWNGKPVFSKKDLGRFPEEGEIVRLIRAQAD